MPKRKVDEEVAAQIRHLKARGEKDSEIAHKLGLDPRTVRTALKKIGKVLDYEHWTAVSRQVDSALLQRHYGYLMLLAISIQEQLKSDLSGLASSRICRSNDSMELVLTGLFKEGTSDSSMGQKGDITYNQFFHKMPGDRRQALGNRLLKGMWEHEPELQEALDQWYQAFDNCQELKRILWRGAESALKRQSLEDSILHQIIPIMIQEVSELAINGVNKGVFELREGGQSSSPVFAYRIIGGRDFHAYHGSHDATKDFCRKYEEVLHSLVPSTKLKRFKEAAGELPRLREEVDVVIDTMLLRGRPGGRCELCPYALLNDPV